MHSHANQQVITFGDLANTAALSHWIFWEKPFQSFNLMHNPPPLQDSFFPPGKDSLLAKSTGWLQQLHDESEVSGPVHWCPTTTQYPTLPEPFILLLASSSWNLWIISPLSREGGGSTWCAWKPRPHGNLAKQVFCSDPSSFSGMSGGALIGGELLWGPASRCPSPPAPPDRFKAGGTKATGPKVPLIRRSKVFAASFHNAAAAPAWRTSYF